jgi:hypothetical protein
LVVSRKLMAGSPNFQSLSSTEQKSTPELGDGSIRRDGRVRSSG